eukprot:TRINITY_DN48588_c0_g1_i1.p1 TRINITY_DN48588_c0_g1~~TRINITY_DN48588_c0_g1_i1.p1  ORF type:complete len:687 (+),score=111.69 TRINITY_DN48588_c0_g1_i1:80-2062(+)
MGGGDAVMFYEKMFTVDRMAREAYPLLAPEYRAADLIPLRPPELGPQVHELGERLYTEGSLPGLDGWEWEESPEAEQSLAAWKEAIQQPGCAEFLELVKKSSRLSFAAYYQATKLQPQMALFRWTCTMRWLESRAILCADAAAGGALGTIDPVESRKALVKVKEWILEQAREIVTKPALLSMTDLDLLGNGVWLKGTREDIPKEARNLWYRRGMEYDVAMLCLQISQLPPVEINDVGQGLPVYVLKQPYGTPDWRLRPQDSAKYILERHGWNATLFQAPIDRVPEEQLLTGMVMHMTLPPPPEIDLDDPDIIEKIQRGEDLGKGAQADGLPGSIHGSVSLYYCLLISNDGLENVAFRNEMLEIEGFVPHIMRYAPPLRSLDFGPFRVPTESADEEQVTVPGCADSMHEGILRMLPLSGETLNYLDLEGCNIGPEHVDILIEAFSRLPGLIQVDLTDNRLDDEAALKLMSTLSTRRIDIATIRLDQNPIQDRAAFRDKLAAILSDRAGQVVGGGDLVLHCGDQSMVWKSSTHTGTGVEELLRDYSGRVVGTSLKDLEVNNKSNSRKLENETNDSRDPAFVRRTPAYQAKTEYYRTVNDHPLIELARQEREVAYKLQQEEKARKAEEEAREKARLEAEEKARVEAEAKAKARARRRQGREKN